ncbi:Growth hormone-regulated TBC protein 1-A [Liparis tanakae]|uniref:Growth hormone-regulated TBC protein 1-A n=1 Tax=Liparis tanakae TaxID=230148 RepID=A0A4Z2F0P8_9TELE|nr:Growth hormone-regulated TBC protein 1-A [Liparis tanakae]
MKPIPVDPSTGPSSQEKSVRALGGPLPAARHTMEKKGNACEPQESHKGSERVDPYGFERRHDFESYKAMMDEYVTVLNRRSMRWSKLLQEKPHVEKNLTGSVFWGL